MADIKRIGVGNSKYPLENINLGATAGDKTVDGARTGGGKINRNFEKIKAFLEM